MIPKIFAVLFLLVSGFCAVPQSAYSQAYSFTTIAGLPTFGSGDGVGENAQFNQPFAAATDTNGNIYVVDQGNFTIRKITPAGIVTTIAGFPGSRGSADGTNSVARFSFPTGVTVDAATNIYVVDQGNFTIRKIAPVGTDWSVTTIVGTTGVQGSLDGTNHGALLAFPVGIALDNQANLFVTDGNTIRKASQSGTNWAVTTIAGRSGVVGSSDGTGTNALFNSPSGIAAGNSGELFMADFDDGTIRRMVLTGSNWGVTTLTSPVFSSPRGVAVGSNGIVYVAYTGSDVIGTVQKVGTNWQVGVLAGTPGASGATDGVGGAALFDTPSGVAVDLIGNIWVMDTRNNIIRKVTQAGAVNKFTGALPGSVDGVGRAARFNMPIAVAVDSIGNAYVADYANNTIRQITPAGEVLTLAGLAGASGYVDGIGSAARFNGPRGVTVDKAGNVYVADSGNYRVRMITPAGVVSTIAGHLPISSEIDAVGTNATFWPPSAITIDKSGNLYVVDLQATELTTIRKLIFNGTAWAVTTILNSPALYQTHGIALDSRTNLYLADSGNFDIKVYDLISNQWVFTAQIGLGYPYGGRASVDGIGTNANFIYPNGIVADGATNLYVTDLVGNIRKITPQGTNWAVSTVAGSASAAGSADGVGDAVRFGNPQGIAMDASGALYVADTRNNTIRKGVFSLYQAAIVGTNAAPVTNGQLQVILAPPEANGQWRFAWETQWRANGSVASNLVAGNYPLQFRNLPGYLAYPPGTNVPVTNGGPTLFTNQYYATVNLSGTTNTGSLAVNLTPNLVNGTGWRFVGESSWQSSGSTATNLIPDTYFIEFESVSNFATPASRQVLVSAGLLSTVYASYQLAQAVPAGVLLPAPVPTNSITDENVFPYGFNGQLQTDIGYGSGVAVQTNVVLTAAHLVFNDNTLSYVSQAYWYSQKEAGLLPPKPQQALGWYVLSGYASQRTNDLLGGYGPDQSSPQSRNLDVAALYFPLPVAGGGYGGYLPSDAQPNTWLTSTANKLLVGYPVDGSVFGQNNTVPGTMYEIGPQPYPLSEATDPVVNQQIYTATWFLSYPGNSGGPLYVALNGYYYPAGIYLGTLYNGIVPYASLVRGIDSNVVNLINLATALGTGTNNGGGVITLIPSASISPTNQGYIIINLGPPSAVSNGASWEFAGQTADYWSTASSSLQTVTSTNALTIQFRDIPGWKLPPNQSAMVVPKQTFTGSGFYTVNSNSLAVNSQGIGLMGLPGTTGTAYRIESRTNLNSGQWTGLKTNSILALGFNLVLPKSSLTNKIPTFYRSVWLTNF